MEKLVEDRVEFVSHFIPGILYVIITSLMLALMIYLNVYYFKI